MTKERLQYLLDRYLNGIASNEEMEEYNNWYNRHAAETDAETATVEPAEMDALYNNIYQEIKEEEKEAPVRSIRMPAWTRVAALLAVMAGIYYFSGAGKRSVTETYAVAKVQDTVPVAPTWKTISNNSRGNSRYEWADGSAVTLFPSSSVTFSKVYGTANRTVFLKGKGYFEVAKNAALPFTVFSGKVSTTALGTSFTIDSYKEETFVKVLLHTGKVVVRSAGNKRGEEDSIYLNAGQEISWNSAGFQKEKVLLAKQPGKRKEPEWSAKWSGADLSFEGTPLPLVLDTLAAIYHTNIQYNRSDLADRLFSGRTRKTDSLEQILYRMKVLHNITYSRMETGFIVERKY